LQTLACGPMKADGGSERLTFSSQQAQQGATQTLSVQTRNAFS